MFSIIIPLYNKENFIECTINSVLNQTYKFFEIIIIDDGSKDNSLVKVQNINDERIRIFSKKNEGVSIARNYGSQFANYDFLIFLDADDYWEPAFLENMKMLIDKFPQCGIYASAFYYRSHNINKLNEHILGSANSFIIEDYCNEIVISKKDICWTGAVCVKKQLFKQAGMFPINIKRGEDLDTWLRIVCITKLAYSRNPYAIYNIETENNATRSYVSYKESFPYWEWNNYAYHNRKSLIAYSKLLTRRLLILSLKNHAFFDAFYLLKKLLFHV